MTFLAPARAMARAGHTFRTHASAFRKQTTSVDLLERHGAMARANAARRRDISRPISWTNLGTTRDDARGFLELERGTDTRRVIHRRARPTDD